MTARVRHNRFLYSLFYVPLKARRLLLSLHTRTVEKRYKSLVGALAYGTVAVRMDDFGGTFECDIRSDILKRIILTREYEGDSLALIQEHLDTGRDAIDIGANCGLFSVYLARHLARGRRVLAVEPTPNALQLLCANLRGNGVADSVIVYRGVAANAPGVYTLRVVAGKEEYSTLGGDISPAHAEARLPEDIDVPGNTVDALVEEFGLVPGFIKIDTEGAECLVLEGAQGTLRLHRPVIMAELMDDYLVRFGHSARQVVDFLWGLDYAVRDILTDEPPLFPFNGNILAVPVRGAPERHAPLMGRSLDKGNAPTANPARALDDRHADPRSTFERSAAVGLVATLEPCST